MTKLYHKKIEHITRQLIDASELLYKAGNLPQAANLIKKTGDFFLSEYKTNPKEGKYRELKKNYEKIHNAITKSMIDALGKSRLNLK
ncbi:hypothetical protein [Natronoflexus pectinivorans]|uniref:Uncharacterized protein n=1 Tax=Natronoflexus pectinivorans TaxID=682526 RepID=A0A4R2GPL6_9BACT|nr:hypothetical protein [Natronoflexus pectinivorans]TCO11027.1 hypothetical protein EV194_101661 [Natronoflexus pectinivorans]